jgi:hypothetical protein
MKGDNMKLNKTYKKLMKIKTPVLISVDAPTDDKMGGGHRVRILYPNGYSVWFGMNHDSMDDTFTQSCFIDDMVTRIKSKFVGSLKDTILKMVDFDKDHELKIKGVYKL